MFNEGDLVTLKSGGPIMTVASNEGEGLFFCQWFVDNEAKQHTFEGASLQLYVESN